MAYRRQNRGSSTISPLNTWGSQSVIPVCPDSDPVIFVFAFPILYLLLLDAQNADILSDLPEGDRQ